MAGKRYVIRVRMVVDGSDVSATAEVFAEKNGVRGGALYGATRAEDPVMGRAFSDIRRGRAAVAALNGFAADHGFSVDQPDPTRWAFTFSRGPRTIQVDLEVA